MAFEVPKGYRARINAAEERRSRKLVSDEVREARQKLLFRKMEADYGPVVEAVVEIKSEPTGPAVVDPATSAAEPAAPVAPAKPKKGK